MPVPSNISDLSKVASENSPAGTESAKGTIDDYFRAHASFIRQLFDQLIGPTVTLASANTVNIGFAASANIAINGTTTINSFDNYAEGTLRWVTFGGSLTLSHNATVMILPGAANIQTSAGDSALFKSMGNGNWKCISYLRIGGTGPVAASTSRDGYLTTVDWNYFAGKQDGGTCLPLAGGTMTGALRMNNGTPILVKDSSGGSRNLVYMDGSNNINLFNSGGVRTRIWNQGFSNILWSIDDNGNTAQAGEHRPERLIVNDGTQSAPSISFSGSGDSDTGFFHLGDGAIGVVCNGVLVAKFTAAGLEVIKVTQTGS